MRDIEEKRLIRMGQKVSYYRKVAKLSVDNLADKIGMSVSTIWQLESPTNPKAVSIKTLWKISDALGVHISKLLVDD